LVIIVRAKWDVKVTNVVSAADMYDACINNYANADIIVMAAAVADFTPKTIADKKIKKETGISSIDLIPTVDIISQIGKAKSKNQILVGFALETDNEEDNARKKLVSKNLDIIVLNSLNDTGAGFSHDTNKVSMFTKTGKHVNFNLKSKKEVAADLLTFILDNSN